MRMRTRTGLPFGKSMVNILLSLVIPCSYFSHYHLSHERVFLKVFFVTFCFERSYLSCEGSFQGFKCGAYSSADSASFFKFEKQKLVADSWDYLKDTVLAYDEVPHFFWQFLTFFLFEEKNTLVFADPKAENTVDVVFQQVKLVPTEDSVNLHFCFSYRLCLTFGMVARFTRTEIDPVWTLTYFDIFLKHRV